MTLANFLQRVISVLEEAQVPYMLTGSLAAAKEASAQEGQFNAIDPPSGWKVDFLIRKSRAFSLSEFERRVRTTALGLDLTMVTKEDLVVAKLEWANTGESELQIRDVRAILRSAGPVFDWDYVDRWVSELGLEEMWEPLRSSVTDRPGGSDQD